MLRSSDWFQLMLNLYYHFYRLLKKYRAILFGWLFNRSFHRTTIEIILRNHWHNASLIF